MLLFFVYQCGKWLHVPVLLHPLRAFTGFTMCIFYFCIASYNNNGPSKSICPKLLLLEVIEASFCTLASKVTWLTN
jgi:hypothetical protein